MSYFQDSAVFIVDVFLGLYLTAFILRFLLQQVRADFRNPICQIIYKATQPLLAPLQRFIPQLYGINLALIILMLVLSMLKLYMQLSIRGYPANPPAVLILSTAYLGNTIVWIFLLAILIQAVASWIAPGSHHPVLQVISSLTQPILSPFRRIIPVFGGLDLSPLAALVALQLLLKLIVRPLVDFGQGLL